MKWSSKEIQIVFKEVKKRTATKEIYKMFPNRTQLAVDRVITRARKHYGITGKKIHQITRIEQYDLEGNHIETFESPYEAFVTTGIYRSGIINCCRGRCKSAGGFAWKFENENEEINRRGVTKW